MHLSLWKPLSHCFIIILDKKPKKKTGLDHNQINTYLEEDGSIAETQIDTFESEDSIPDINQSFSKFIIMYPKYKSTEKVDLFRSDEYSHLSDHFSKVCLDYCGFGLFSFLQTVHYWDSCTFNLSEITTNLTNHALYGGASKGTIEYDIKIRIMDYLNIPENEYELVFTVSRGSAFKLLAESYPFHTNKKLLTMFDHESQSVNLMAQCAKNKGAKVQSAWFKLPTLKVSSTDLRNQISNKKRKKKKTKSGTGLFVFPVQSRVTGAKYSYQWMSLAQQYNWHVLLDAGALGPKDMDSLGLSLFRPDFIITSFYRVFGYDPTGFGCLLIKKSVIRSLETKPGHTGSGIVKISPSFPAYLSDSDMGLDRIEDDDVAVNGSGAPQPAFSGAYTSNQVREVFDTDMDMDDKDSDFDESGTLSVGEMMKSPVFSDGESSENSLWIGLGPSPDENDNNGGSNSPEPPFWFKSKNQIKHLGSPKAGSNITNNIFIPTSKEFDRLHNNQKHEIEEVNETNERNAKISLNLENVIRRETEGEFRLLGGREVNFSATNIEDDDYTSDNNQESSRHEPEIICRHLIHVDMLGLNKTTLRLRFLVNWLVKSLLQLRIRSNDQESTPLVYIYGPRIKLERGGSVAFNIRDKNKRLINPEIVQKLADKNGISIGIGILSHIRNESEGDDGKSGFIRFEVVTASLGFLTNFSDVYKLWAFVAKFMNPGFINGGLSPVVEDE